MFATGRFGARKPRSRLLKLGLMLALAAVRPGAFDEVQSIDCDPIVFSVKPLPEFTSWLNHLADA